MQHPLALRFPSRVAVVAALLVACGGDGGTAPDTAIASIDIAGAPVVPVPAGTSVQLSAIVRNAKGAPLTGRTVTWRSGDPLIALVDQSGLVTALDGGAAMITATVEGKTARATVSVAPLGVANVTVSPITSKLYVNGTLQMHADVKDAKGRLLTGHTIAWHSSDASKATIDGNGMVRALAEGFVTITATSDAIAGNATVTVIPPALVDWSGAAEWPTFQGNASHTGYVPVTVDPNAFNERWVMNVSDGPLNQAAAADGKIFATTSWGTLYVLDERTGTRIWAYGFGAGANPPAYGDGAVFVETAGNSYLWGLDANTGTIRFRTPYGTQGFSYQAPVVLGRAVIFGGGQYGGMYSMSTTDGTQQWYATLDMYDRFTPSVRDGLAYVYTRHLEVVDVATGARVYEIADPNTKWQFLEVSGAAVLGTLDDAIATQGGRLLAFDLANRQVKWERSASFSGTVTIANGVLYVVNDGRLEARQESDGAPLWSWTPPDGAASGTTIVTNNVLFVRSSAKTYAIGLATHTPVWTYESSGHLALTRDGVLLIAQESGKLAAIDLK